MLLVLENRELYGELLLTTDVTDAEVTELLVVLDEELDE